MADAKASRISEGAYGKVYLDAKRGLASKFMPLQDGDRYLPYYIIREVALLRKCERLQVPHVIRLLKFRVEKEYAILDFPLYRECLYSFLVREISRTERLRVGKLALWNILTAFAHMHNYDLLYRDCKPSNILIHDNGKDVVLADFGGTREVLGPETGLVPLSAEVCTHLYAPPEAFGVDYGPKADIYSLGVSVMQIMLGKSFPNEPIQDFSALKRDWRQLQVPEKPVYEIVLRMIATRPENRPTAVEALTFLTAKGTTWRVPILLSPAFRNIARYWEKFPEAGFSSFLRRQIVGWIFDTAVFLAVPASLIIYMVQLFDEFLSRWLASTKVTKVQLPALATAILSLSLKFYTKDAPEAETLIAKLKLGEKFTVMDLLSWEKSVLLVLNGTLLPRPVPKLLLRPVAAGSILRWVLMQDRFTVAGELPSLLQEAKIKES